MRQYHAKMTHKDKTKTQNLEKQDHDSVLIFS